MAALAAQLSLVSVGAVNFGAVQNVQRCTKTVALSGPLRKSIVGSPLTIRTSSRVSVQKRSVKIVSKASTEDDIGADINEAVSGTIKEIQEAWDKTDDKLAISALGVSGLVVLWAASGLLGAIDRLPIIPAFLEFVGLLFSGYFVYRYLLFKPDREELLKIIGDTKNKITGQ
eukprot:jgi/Mesen1/8448/ME000475S07706